MATNHTWMTEAKGVACLDKNPASANGCRESRSRNIPRLQLDEEMGYLSAAGVTILLQPRHGKRPVFKAF